MSSQRKITAILTAKPGRLAELETLLRDMIEPCRAEPGNLRWDIWRSQDDPAQFVLDELYSDDEAIAAHRASAHFKRYVTVITELATRLPIVSRPYDVGGSS